MVMLGFGKPLTGVYFLLQPRTPAGIEDHFHGLTYLLKHRIYGAAPKLFFKPVTDALH